MRKVQLNGLRSDFIIIHNLSCLFILSHKGKYFYTKRSYLQLYTLQFGCSGFGKKRIEDKMEWNT